MARHEIKVGTVSWINDHPNPMYSTLQAVTLYPDWIPKTYLGLSATSNPKPPESLPDFPAYRQRKHFRAMTLCHFYVDIDDQARRVTGFQVIDAFHDGGWTPPFRMLDWPSTFVKPEPSIWDPFPYPGEYSPLSVVRTQARHPNTTISSVPNSETVLVDALIKFRAGQHTDDIGINFGSPNHVPWVWCEIVLTYVNRQFKMYGCGSIFPSHAWYFNSRSIRTQAQVGDATFPVMRYGPIPQLQIQRMPGAHLRALPPPAVTIAENQLRLYPVLTTGAPAGGPQSSLSDETKRTGPVNAHPYTVSGGETWSKSV